MSIIAWIVIGLVAGWLASLVIPGVTGGFLLDMIVGMVGALIGGFIFRAFGAAGTTGFNLWSLFVAFVGAVILLWIVKAVEIRRT